MSNHGTIVRNNYIIMQKLSILFLLIVSSLSNAQVRWVTDLELAQSMALAQNKLILIDFWATWCGPCKTMDQKMWNSEIINEVRDNFIGLKIDIDKNRSMAKKYGVTTIPNVIIIDPAENKYWSQVGFSSPSPYLAILEKLPKYSIDDELVKQEVNGNSDEFSWNQLGIEYQQLAKSTEYKKIKNSIFIISNKYFKRATKKGTDAEILANSNFNVILNDAYQGKIKKALKQALKVEDPSNELSNFILAYCYKCNENDEALKKYKNLVKSPELLAQLE